METPKCCKKPMELKSVTFERNLFSPTEKVFSYFFQCNKCGKVIKEEDFK